MTSQMVTGNMRITMAAATALHRAFNGERCGVICETLSRIRCFNDGGANTTGGASLITFSTRARNASEAM
jgi:hypothetical protein